MRAVADGQAFETLRDNLLVIPEAERLRRELSETCVPRIQIKGFSLYETPSAGGTRHSVMGPIGNHAQPSGYYCQSWVTNADGRPIGCVRALNGLMCEREGAPFSGLDVIWPEQRRVFVAYVGNLGEQGSAEGYNPLIVVAYPENDATSFDVTNERFTSCFDLFADSLDPFTARKDRLTFAERYSAAEHAMQRMADAGLPVTFFPLCRLAVERPYFLKQ